MTPPPKAFVTFTLQELWLLEDFVRADCQQIDTWKYPPANADMNEDIALAIHVCETDKLPEYTLELSHGDLIVIDNVIRRDFKHPDGAKGIDILRKTYAARYELASGKPIVGQDRTYEEVMQHDKSRDNANDHADGDADSKAG